MEITLAKHCLYPSFVEGIRRAPDRGYTLTPCADGYGIEERFALHPQRAARNPRPEFMEELGVHVDVSMAILLPPAGRPQSETHR